MAERDHLTRCKQWYELNLAALRFSELYGAGGWGTLALGTLLWGIPRLLGKRVPAGMLFPEEVTLIWDVSRAAIAEPKDVLDLDFRILGAFELPEFTGENVTVLLHDRARTTYRESVFARAGGEEQTGIVFSSYLPGKKPILLKTVQTWKTSPLVRPAGFPCRCVPGPLEGTYRAHREWLATFRQKASPTTMQDFLEISKDSHQTLLEHYINRNIYVEARPELVKDHLRKKKLLRPDRHR